MRNTSLKDAALNIFSQAVSCLFQVDLKLWSTATGSSTYTYNAIKVDEMMVTSNYEKTYSDVTHISFPIAPSDYADLYDLQQGLMATLTLTPVNKDGSVNAYSSPQAYIFKATIVNPQDLKRTTPDVHNYTEITMNISMLLVEEDIYDIKQVSLQAIAHNATIPSVITRVLTECGITKAHVVTPDNIATFDHVIIPPTQTFSSVFSKLQTDYGIYMLGVNSYYFGGRAYIYPPFDTLATDFPNTLYLYQLSGASMVGSDSYHTMDATSIKVVVVEYPDIRDLSLAASENVGTHVTFLRQSQIIDGIVDLSPGSAPTYKQDSPTLQIGLVNNKSASAAANNVVYSNHTDNMWVVASKLAQHQCIYGNISWQRAIPYSIQPGHKVVYVSDNNGSMASRTGIVAGVTYEGKIIMRSSVPVFAFKATITCRLSVTETATATIES